MSDHQEQVDEMLALGRSVIGEHYTNPLKETLSQKLTDFIQVCVTVSVCLSLPYSHKFSREQLSLF